MRRHTDQDTRQGIYEDFGGEMRFWLAWVHAEIDPAVQRWFRRQARRDPALSEDLASLDAPTARDAVQSALEATGYLTPATGVAAVLAGGRPPNLLNPEALRTPR